jgi:hypothetical protein
VREVSEKGEHLVRENKRKIQERRERESSHSFKRKKPRVSSRKERKRKIEEEEGNPFQAILKP